MQPRPLGRILAIFFTVLPFLATVPCHADAALLMEEPYGFFGLINPTGHNAIYFQNICAESPTRLRRCLPGEMGSVISRYEGVDGRDWVAVPLIPYLYAVEDVSDAPRQVTRTQVKELRNQYRLTHFTPLGLDNPHGSYVRDAWKYLIGVSYERQIYAFRFKTTQEQDDATIAWLNDSPNVSHFQMLYRNCADFARTVLNNYFPKSFRRNIFPDAGITTPKQVTYNLVRYARKHPELELAVFVIPQIPGFRRRSHSNKDIAESFTTTAYAIPLTLVNPYLAAIIFVDYIARGHYHLIPRNPKVLSPETLSALTAPPADRENASGAKDQAEGAAPVIQFTPQTRTGAESGLKESAGP